MKLVAVDEPKEASGGWRGRLSSLFAWHPLRRMQASAARTHISAAAVLINGVDAGGFKSVANC